MTAIAAAAWQRFRANPARACVAVFALLTVLVYGLPFIWALQVHFVHGVRAIDLTEKDFVNYWLGARMSLDGTYLDLFTQNVYFERLKEQFGPGAEIRNWSYPPHFLLMLWPLGYLPYGVALGVFLATTLALFIVAVRVFRANVAPSSDAWMVGAAVFAYAVVVVHATQNGLLTGALLLFGLAWMRKRPVLAGLAFACLTIKPQLGLLIPVLLVFDRNWRTVAWAAAFTVLLVAISVLVYGIQSWQLYLTETLAYQRYVMTDWYGIFLRMMPTAFASIRALDFAPAVATLLQVPVSIGAGGLLLWILGRERDPLSRAFVVLCATFLISPYGFNYDMGALSAVAAMLASSGRFAGNRASTVVCAVVAVLPGIVLSLGLARVPVAPPLLAAGLIVIALDLRRRAATIEAAPALPRFVESLTSALSLRSQRLFLAMVLLSAAPLWIAPNLPMVDIPQHAGQVAALREMFAGNPTFTQLFDINWFTPYLLGYLLLYLVSLVLPIAVATQLLVSAAIVAVPLLTGALLRAAGADERWKWLAIPGSFSFAFYWGLFSFMVAFVFALLFLLYAIRYARQPNLVNGVLIAVFAVFLFFCHVIALAFTGLVAVAYVLASSSFNLKSLFVRLLPFAAPLPLMVVWLLVTYQGETAAANTPIEYKALLYRLVVLLSQPAGRESLFPVLCGIVTGAIALLPWLGGSTFSRRPERWLPFALALLVFLIVPESALDTGFIFQRLGGFLVPLWLLAWDAPAVPTRRFEWLGVCVVVLWAAAGIARFAAFARETESFRALAPLMEPGRRVASMVVENGSPLFTTPVYMHFPAWYQATQRGVVDFNFADFFPQPVRYRGDAGPRLNEHLGWAPTDFHWNQHGGDQYDYFVVKASADVSPLIFKEHRPAVQLVARSGWWWLYRNVERTPQTALR